MPDKQSNKITQPFAVYRTAKKQGSVVGPTRKLHGEELTSLHPAPKVIKRIKWRKIKWKRQGRPEICGRLRQLGNLAPFKQINFKILRPKTGLGKIFEGARSNFGYFSEKFFRVWKYELTIATSTSIPVTSLHTLRLAQLFGRSWTGMWHSWHRLKPCTFKYKYRVTPRMCRMPRVLRHWVSSPDAERADICDDRADGRCVPSQLWTS